METKPLPHGTYDLHILGTDPKKLPLDSLAEVMSRLADVMGSKAYLRFKGLRKGSARLLAEVLPEAQHDVFVQLSYASNGEGPAAQRAHRLNVLLGSIGLRAELRDWEGRVLLRLPGAANDAPAKGVRTVQQMDSLVGVVIKIGGRDETVPMTLQSSTGEYVDVNVKGRDLAKQLGMRLFGEPVRVSGLATWTCDQQGRWECTTMMVDEFQSLDDTSLPVLFQALMQVPGNDWHRLNDPHEYYRRWNSEDE